MKLLVKVNGSPEDLMVKELELAEHAVTKGIRSAGWGLKEDWRSQIQSAGLGTKLARTIRQQSYPLRGKSLKAASLVYSRASKVVDAHDRGVLIRSNDGFFLAIPIGLAANMRGPQNKRITPGGFERRTGFRLRFVYRRGQPSLLVAEDARFTKRGRIGKKGGRRRKDGILTGAQTIPVFLLVPQVKLKKRLDLDRDTELWESRLPGLIVANWKDR
ncbi:DUF6441 family protein [Pseudovibrio sp. POLY-S9]|uniref:DUF6441 family protein n=1 Tax=Pseudovibrio sp. POLY-S9 TaxID=1576596 RepID=UPI0007099624|nr:DUF6441 family protein [Pseudovibrio sp. POLY-S9]